MNLNEDTFSTIQNISVGGIPNIVEVATILGGHGGGVSSSDFTYKAIGRWDT